MEEGVREPSVEEKADRRGEIEVAGSSEAHGLLARALAHGPIDRVVRRDLSDDWEQHNTSRGEARRRGI